MVEYKLPFSSQKTSNLREWNCHIDLIPVCVSFLLDILDNIGHIPSGYKTWLWKMTHFERLYIYICVYMLLYFFWWFSKSKNLTNRGMSAFTTQCAQPTRSGDIAPSLSCKQYTVEPYVCPLKTMGASWLHNEDIMGWWWESNLGLYLDIFFVGYW